MERQCLGCDAALKGQQRKWCSNACSQRVSFNRSKRRPDKSRSWVPTKTCAHCGTSIEGRGPQAKYCSQRCRWDVGHDNQTERARQTKRDAGEPLPGDMIPCANPQCFNAAVYASNRAFCSRDCNVYFHSNRHWLGQGPSTRVCFRPCPDCQAPVTMTKGNGTPKVCKSCRVVRNKGINGRKNHARRTIGPPALSVHELAARDGCRCHICHRKIDMALTGLAKWGPTIEHILPVSKGGTNEPENLALAHRHCNTARGNRGHSQMTLVA